MRSFAGLPLVLVLALGASACVDRPIALDCGPHKLTDFASFVPPTNEGQYKAVLASMVRREAGAANVRSGTAATRSSAPHRSRDLVVLSGGGQWGAFGAGFLTAWAKVPSADPKARPLLPDEVTGVSTGAIQATTVFLGKQYDGYLESRYTIERESELVHDNGKAFIVGHASLGNQANLVRYVIDSLEGGGHDLVTEVANSARERRLFVGTVDAASGQLIRIDLVKLARGFAPDQKPARDRCYAAAIVASAAIPIEFRQVTVDNTVYIDGGVRQSAFVVQQIAERMNQDNRFDRIFLIMNQDLEIDKPPKLSATLLNEIPYTIRPMLNQIEQSSIDNIGEFARCTQARSYYVTTDKASAYCKAHTIDFDKYKFFAPEFMACLIKQGEDTDALSAWQPIAQ